MTDLLLVGILYTACSRATSARAGARPHHHQVTSPSHDRSVP